VKNPLPNKSKPLVYLISDRQLLHRTSEESQLEALKVFLSEAFDAGVDMVQIREKDLGSRELLSICEHLRKRASQPERILVNDRADVAAAAGVGVHLRSTSMPVDAVRRAFGDEMRIGASTHSFDEVRRAEQGGANFVVFGSIFETASKAVYGPPVGLEALREVTRRTKIPVLALGGINLSNFRDVFEAGASGVAGISLFTAAKNLQSVVDEIKRVDLSGNRVGSDSRI
jgi:thiamine-phosphate pyrophosphorylase